MTEKQPSDLVLQFERECAAADIRPTAALKTGGVHPTLWKKWRDGSASPTLRNFDAARAGLQVLIRRKAANSGVIPQDAAA
jgi:hypothetical protein